MEGVSECRCTNLLSNERMGKRALLDVSGRPDIGSYGVPWAGVRTSGPEPIS